MSSEIGALPSISRSISECLSPITKQLSEPGRGINRNIAEPSSQTFPVPSGVQTGVADHSGPLSYLLIYLVDDIGTLVYV
mgnify:CR=1 FL=1